jgi:hypothetical protein
MDGAGHSPGITVCVGQATLSNTDLCQILLATDLLGTTCVYVLMMLYTCMATNCCSSDWC